MTLLVTKIFLKETFRNIGVLLANFLPALIFIILSIFLSKVSSINSETMEYIVRGQFVTMSILLTIFSLSFSNSVIYLTDKRSEQAFEWMNKTNLKFINLFIGVGLGTIILLNIFLVFIVFGFNFTTGFTIGEVGNILLVSNVAFITIYPLSYVVSNIFPNGRIANSMLVPIMLILLFSITMTDLFVTLAESNPQDFYKFLIWNPMLFFNDSLQNILGMKDSLWLSLEVYSLTLVLVFVILTAVSKRTFKYLK
ncbi:ABC transporter permease [Solibacillus silvestris]